jgi:hypothetical protein
LLEQLHDIYLNNTRESILKTCAKTYKAMLSQEHAMRKEAEVAFGRLTDELADRLLQALPTLDPAVRRHDSLKQHLRCAGFERSRD